MVGYGLDDFSRDNELTAGHVAHARCPRDVAGIMIRNDAVVVGGLVQREDVSLDQVKGEFAYVLRHWIALIQIIKGPDQRVPEIVRNPPGMAAFTHDDAFYAQRQRCFTHAHGNIFHLLIVANEQAEIAGLGGMRTQGPAYAGGVKYFGVSDQAFYMRLGKEICRRRDQ